MNSQVRDNPAWLKAALAKIGVTSDTAATSLGRGTWANRPGSPVDGDRYYDTARDTEFFWNGTRWVTEIQTASIELKVAVGVAQNYYIPLPTHSMGIVWEATWLTSWVTTTNNATNYWNLTTRRFDGAGGFQNSVTVDTKANGVAGYVQQPDARTSVVMPAGTLSHFMLAIAKVLSPGPINISAVFVYRFTGD